MMPTFVMLCHDKPDSLALRMDTREAHLKYVGERLEGVLLAGPLLDDAGDLCGSMFVLEAESQDDVVAFNENDPYTKAALFERVEIKPFKPLVGQFLQK